jgi:endonuclease/exonuclease/phosphatase family metal-dependent hydrolase
MYLEPVAPASAFTAPAADVGSTVPAVAAIARPTLPEPPGAATEISVLTYNVRGLPWPIALGRGRALKEIGRELAALRREGRQPDVVLIQEGFRGEIADLVRESGYRYWAQGPSRSERAAGEAPEAARGRDLHIGEGLGKFVGAGLHVLSDAPIVDVKSAAYRSCAGYDCLANKGAMLVRLAPKGAPMTVDIVNTHMNSRRASKAPAARALSAHNDQTRELIDFINAYHEAGAPMLVGGDFNVKNAPQRYYYEALDRPFTVVSEFCTETGSGCGPGAPDAAAEPWLRSQDLQGFGDGAVRVQPVKVETLFTAPDPKARLSDHDGYLVRYRLSWNATTLATYHPRPDMVVKPQATKGRFGVKVAWKR